jgi:hypothetical protein
MSSAAHDLVSANLPAVEALRVTEAGFGEVIDAAAVATGAWSG